MAKKSNNRYAKEQIFTMLGIAPERWRTATERLRQYRKGRSESKVAKDATTTNYDYEPKLIAGMDYDQITERMVLYTESGVVKIREFLADLIEDSNGDG